MCQDELERLRQMLCGNSPNSDSPANTSDSQELNARIKQLEHQLVALQNYEDEYNRIRQDNDRQLNLLHQVSQERDRLREQLDKMTSIEDKLLALKSKADSASVIEGERDDLIEKVAQQEQAISNMHEDQRVSRESLNALQKENREMIEKADIYRKSADEYRVRIKQNYLPTNSKYFLHYRKN